MQIISKIKEKSVVHRYKEGDEKLFHSTIIPRSFGTINDYVEYHVYDINGNLLNSEYNFQNYKPTSRDRINVDGTYKAVELDPAQDLINLGYREGDLTIQYNFFKNRLLSNIENNYFIKEISQDRTEISVSTNLLSNSDIEEQANILIQEINNTAYYKDYLLNFGNNKLSVVINVALDKSEEFYNILFKLYEPLPLEFTLKDTFWIVEEITQSPIFELDLESYIKENLLPKLRGPNFNIDLDDIENSSLNYHSYNDLLTTSSFSSSYQQIFNILNQKGVNINVDYTEYSNFINFSSATERLENFKYKLQLIESYNSQSYVLNTIITSSNYVNENKEILKNKIDSLISKFDGYEYFLYYNSGSKSWPKQNTTKPYNLYPTTSSYAISWFNENLTSSSYYDQENKNNLEYTVPEFIKNDSQNNAYLLFLNMIGQHFDNIWIFINSITDIKLADNKLTEGISKDLIVDVLKSLGVKLYSSNSNINLFDYLIGSNQNNNRYSYNENTGSYFTTLVTASLETIPKEDINKEILKRIYHNLPVLLKAKGTERGLRTLINCYGIPDTILRINEFGGSDKESGSLERIFNKFSYSTYLNNNGRIQVPWNDLSLTNLKPNAVEFRFKLSSSYNIPTQSLFEVSSNFKIELTKLTGSYGSIVFKYGSSSTSFITLPYINDDWWNVLLNKESNSTVYTLSVKNNLKDYLGWTGSVSMSTIDTTWDTSGTANFGGSGSIYYQEIRYWTEAVSQSIFNKHVFNPESFEGNLELSAYSTLAYRLPLGNNLVTSSLLSVHPNQNTQSFLSGTQLATIISGSYISQEEIYYLDSFKGGFVRVNDKIRIRNSNTLTGSVLSSYIQLENNSSSLSNDLHYVEVAFSPTHEINNDILNQLGSFKLDNYIGTPTDLYSSSYQDLDVLKREYFRKYLRKYNYFDYIRLIKFFDNSLFKLIKDFIPGRSKDITGLVIESPVLERNKFKQNRPSTEQQIVREINLNTASISNDKSYLYNFLDGDKKPFYNGELSGSNLNIYNYFHNNPNSITLFLNNYSSSISGTIENLIYDENTGSEWSGSYQGSFGGGGSVDFNYTTQSYRDTKSTKISIALIYGAPQFIDWTSPNSIDLSNYSEIEFYIYLDSDFPLFSNRIKVQFLNGGSAITQLLSLDSGSYGYNRFSQNTWQKINVPISAFNPITGSSTGNLTFRVQPSINGGGSVNWILNIDYIRLINTGSQAVIYTNLNENQLNFNYMDNRLSNKVKLDGKYNGEDILSKTQLQDSYDELTTHKNSRYEGVRVNSLEYNNYNDGDNSYGKTAVIDKNVKKLGLFTQIHESNLLPKRNNISLIYLVDESGSLTELNKRNRNWVEVQNSFIAGDNLIVSLFDNQKYSNQKTLDGERLIFDSGYFYSPVLYFSTCSSDPRLYFENLSNQSSFLATANNFSSSYYIAGGSPIGFPLSGQNVMNLFNNQIQDNDNKFIPGTVSTHPSYSVGETGQYKVYANFNVGLSSDVSLNSSWSLQLYKNGTLYSENIKNLNVRIDATGSTDGPWNTLYSPYQSAISAVGTVTANKSILLGSTNYPAGTQLRKWNTPLFKVGADCNTPLNTSDSGQVWYTIANESNDTYTGIPNCFPSSNPNRWVYYLPNFWEIPDLETDGSSSIAEFNIDLGYTYMANAVSANLNDEFRFEFKLLGTTYNYYTASISQGSMVIGSLSQTTGYASTTCPYFDSSSFSSSIDEIIFSRGISSFYGGNYLFTPNPLTGSQNSLYFNYGDVDYPFYLKQMDLITAYLSDNTYYESRIIRAYIDSLGLLRIQVQNPLSQLMKNDLASNNFSKFLLLSRIDDETNTIITFRKRQGSTSYGFIIPSNLDKNMLKNIDKITEEVRLKLIDNGINIDGGVF